MILIADDSKFMRISLKRILQEHGYSQFVEAENGLQAVLLYRLVKPKLVFLDITMPVKDGLTALQEIKEMDRDAKVVICTSLSTEDNKKRAYSLGAAAFITKPHLEAVPSIAKKLYANSGGRSL